MASNVPHGRALLEPPPESPSAPAAPAPARPLWRQFFEPSRLVRLALLIGVVVAAPRVGEHLPDLRGRSEYQFGPEQVTVTPPPKWVSGNLVQETFQSAQFGETVSLLDDSVTVDLAEAFAKHPWVAEVRSVRRSFPPKIRVELDYRQPVAMIQVPQGLYPVDIDGTLLPSADFSAEAAREYPLVIGVRSSPLNGLGRDWGDPVVAAAARLASALAPRWKALKLEAIVCPKSLTARDDPFAILSNGSRILWGRPPGTDDPAEPTTAQKIGRLDKYAADCGAFNLPRGPYEIDIRHFREISRRPLAAR